MIPARRLALSRVNLEITGNFPLISCKMQGIDGFLSISTLIGASIVHGLLGLSWRRPHDGIENGGGADAWWNHLEN